MNSSGKECTCCREYKDYADFSKNSNTDRPCRDGYDSWCKKCRRNTYLENRDHRIIKSLIYAENNKEKKREYDKRYREEHKGELQILRKVMRLARRKEDY